VSAAWGPPAKGIEELLRGLTAGHLPSAFARSDEIP
jgi:hypothetical protein